MFSSHIVRRVLRASLLLACVLAVFGGLATAAQPTRAAGGYKAGGATLAFYYVWYDASTFNLRTMSSLPSQAYNSGDDATISRQISQARAAGVDAFITSWDGINPNGDYEKRLKRLMQLSAGTGFSTTIYFETGYFRNRSPNNTEQAIIDAINYLKANYLDNPNWFHYNGKPVIYFWDPRAAVGGVGDSTAAAAWARIRRATDPNFTQIWSVDTINPDAYLPIFDGIHDFGGAWWGDPGTEDRKFRAMVDNYNQRNGTKKMWMAGVMPGYDDTRVPGRGDTHIVNRNNGDYYRRSWNGAISSNPEMAAIVTWNEWFEGSAIEPGQQWGDLYLNLTRDYSAAYKGSTTAFGDPAITPIWQRPDLPIANNRVSRSYVWGPKLNDAAREPYSDSPNGARMVYYFDKARMEIGNPQSDPNAAAFVTNGLLVTEMISGNLQVGNNNFQHRSPASVPVAGNPTNNPTCPTYASLAGVATLTSSANLPANRGHVIVETLDATGKTGTNNGYNGYNVRTADYIRETGHNIADVFQAYFATQGVVFQNGGYPTGQVVDWIPTMGFPTTEPYWTKATVGDKTVDVLVQAFQRRVLTYEPGAPEAYRVQMGNVGQHYHIWRYGK